MWIPLVLLLFAFWFHISAALYGRSARVFWESVQAHHAGDRIEADRLLAEGYRRRAIAERWDPEMVVKRLLGVRS